MKKMKLSVIVPIYIIENYLPQCIESIISQTFQDFELILVDDGSPDSCPAICDKYAKKDNRIIVMHKSNGGLVSARKAGLQIAKGEYVGYVDGDDYWLDENKLQKQFDAMENNPSCKLCLCKVRAVQENGEKMDLTYPRTDFNAGLYESFGLLETIFKEYSFQTSGYFLDKKTMKMYYAEKPAFLTVAPVGDWSYLLYFSQNDIYYVNDEMSCYRKNAIGNFSTTMNASSINKQKKYYSSMIEMINEYDKYTNYKYHNLCKQFDRFNEYYYRLLLQEKNYKEIFSNKLYKEFLKKETKKDQLAIRLSYYCPWLIKVVKQSKIS